MPRFFFAGDIGDIYCFSECDARPSASLERVCKQLLGSKARLSPLEQSVKLQFRYGPKLQRNLLRRA